MSSHEKQESGQESAIGPLESSVASVTTGVDAIFRDQDCVEDHVVSTLDSLPFENTLQRVFESSPASNMVIGEPINTISPAISQIPKPVPSVPSNSQPDLSTGGGGKSEADSKDLNIPHMQSIGSDNATARQNYRHSVIQIVDEARELSVIKCPGTFDKTQETDTANSLQQIGLLESASFNAGATTSSFIRTVPPAHEHLIGTLNPHLHIKSKQRTENLPRLNLLDLPLLGITPPSQDVDAAPTTLERMQGSPPVDACALRSSDAPDDQDPEETSQISQARRHSTDLPCPQSISEPHLVTTLISNARPTGVDDDPGDEVTFIISVPRRRKKRKRTESTLINKPAGEQANTVTSDTNPVIGPTPRQSIATTIRPSSVPQTSEENVSTISEPPVTDVQLSPSTTSRSGSLSFGSACVTEINKQDRENLSPLERTTRSEGSFETPGDGFERSVPAATSKNKGIREIAQTPHVKRKVGSTVSEECSSAPPMKRLKAQNDQQRESQSIVVDQTNHSTRRCGTTPNSPNATSSTNSLGHPKPGITNSQLHSAADTASNGYLVKPTAPRSAHSVNPQMPVAGLVPLQGALRDLRRRPSLYSIPSWPSTPISSSPSGNLQQRPSMEGANPPDVNSQVTQNSKSPSSSGHSPVSQNAQSDTLDSSPLTSKTQCSPQSHTAIPSQQYVIQRSMDSYIRPANSLPGQHVYTASTWPPKSFLTVGQQMQKGCLRPQSQQFTLSPQEYARSLHSQYTQSNKHGDDNFQQQSRYATISPQIRTTELSPNSNGPSQTMSQSEALASTNLLVDIAQTCQAIFPFARVAERHNQPVKKVFDAFSAVIQIPLLRAAADRRRNGKLGNARLKNFRESSNVVSEVHEKERKSEKQSAKMRDELAPPPAKKAKGKPKPTGGKGLLEKAIANSQRNATGSK